MPVLLLQLVVSLAGLRPALRACHWASIRSLVVGAAIATPLGAWGLAHLPAGPVRLVIAGTVAAGAVTLAREGGRLAKPPTGLGVLPFGLLSGLFNGLAGIPGPPVIAFYLASPIATGVARASMIVFFLFTSLLAIVPMASLGLLGRSAAITACMTLPAVLLGSWLGGLLYGGAAGRHYRAVSLALLFATAAISAARAAWTYAS